jgi:hypothetical protein
MLAALLVLPGMASPVVAAELYDVEVIVFSNRSGADDGEQMSIPSIDAARASGVFPQDQFTELAPRLYTMDSIRSTLAALPGYAVLFHRAWRQLPYDRENAVDYPVHTFSDNGRDSIEGTVTLIRERYLHLDMDLLLMSAGSSAPVQYSDGPGSVPAYRLSEKRRIRSGELHYFDHPRFGVIARVTPYASPEQPVAPPEDEEVLPGDVQVPVEEEAPVTPEEQLTR